MKASATDRIIAYLTLLSGLCISAVAEYYSIMGLMAIFAAAVIPIIIMGVALGISKLVATVWIKTNWKRAPFLIKSYLLIAIAVLMLITSMGIFGFLSKAHSDQSLVSGDVQAKISVYDEKIKTAKENIDANRKALRQMDEAVDQVMGRSTSETGADKAVAIRKAQAKERARLQSEIVADQKAISKLNEERAPIAAEVRKVEAEVGPIKYIANFIYGDNPNANILDKAVTWVIVIIVIVFDPLAVVLLLASQYSFQWFREEEEESTTDDIEEFFKRGKEVARKLDEEAAADKLVDSPDTLPEEIHSESIPDVVTVVPVYPANDEDIDELADAIKVAKAEVRQEEIVEQKSTVETATTTPIPLVVTNSNPADNVPLVASTPVEFAPPGTPGEAWTAPDQSEQQAPSNIDKIYKASAEELAKQHRNRGWFQAVFPKNDN